MLEHKTQKIAPSKHALSDKLQQTFDELTKFNQSSTWIGFYIDEAYDKIQYNMKSRSTDMMPITLIV
jgi:putative methionine-R-sulfoxide reductase with GAF domain